MSSGAGHSREALIGAARRGDPAALDGLLRACQTDARRYARRHCHASDIDDAVQESLLAVTRKLGALKAVAAFSGWLFTIIKRECLRLARVGLGDVPMDEHAAEARLAQRTDEALRIDLIAALEALPAHYREVLLLRDFEELGVAEIAQRLGEPAGAVKSRLHRARASVRTYLTGV